MNRRYCGIERMPRAKSIEWVEVGRPVQQTGLQRMLDQLEKDEVIKMSESGSLYLAVGIPCRQQNREEFSHLIQHLIIQEDETLEHYENTKMKSELNPKSLQRPLVDDPMVSCICIDSNYSFCLD